MADLYIQRYNEVINDDEFLNFISKNQIDWANNNILGEQTEKITFELLKLNDWLN